jgi:hypothetical protein
MENINKYLNLIFISNDWKIFHRKHLYSELFLNLSAWSEIVIVQHAVGLIGHFFTQFRQKILGLLQGNYKTTQIQNKVHIFTPVILFHYGFMLKDNIFSKIDVFLMSFQLKRYIKKNYSNRKIIIWVHVPNMLPVLKKIKYAHLIYDYLDNIDYSSNGKFNETVCLKNNELIKKSDIVICTAKILYSKAKEINSASFLINNGNDYKTLSNFSVQLRNTELSALDKPIIGYLGGIRDWLDFELLNYVIQNLPDVYFVFIGLIYRDGKNDFKKIVKHKNVLWIKYKQQNELPGYLRKFSAGLIPFKINEFMKGVFPNKFYEYMACEIPIISTALPDLKVYSDIIGYCYNKEDFLHECKEAINGKFTEQVKKYSEIAKENSWEKKASIINNILNEDLGLL